MLKPWTERQKGCWNDTVAYLAEDGGLLQSWEWGQFQEKLGNAVYNLSDKDEKWYAQCFQLRAGNQWILSIPRGPIGPDPSDTESLKAFLNDIKAFAKKRGCFLVRLDPPSTRMRLEQVAKKAGRERNPVHTLILDTSFTEEELLGQMKSKSRYNIRLAEKRGVTIRRSSNPDDAELFAEIMAKTTDRQDFASYDTDYFRALMSIFGKRVMAEFYFAEYEGKTVAAILVAYFGRRAYYLHGGSDHEHRAVMAPHLLQWEAIKESRKRALEYDFWGIAAEPPANAQEKKWAGVTRFKRGFAPEAKITEYPGTYELPVDKLKYVLYKARETFRR